MKKILIVGAGGQIGSELTTYLRSIYGDANVVASDMRESKALGEAGPFELLDALDAKAYAGIVSKYKIDSIFNLVALLSATGEKIPQKAWEINIGALMNSLEIARENNCALFTAQFDRCVRPVDAERQDSPGHADAPDDDLWRLQGNRRIAG